MNDFIEKEEHKKYIGKVVFACFPEKKEKTNARLVEYDEEKDEYLMYCGYHKNAFRCKKIKEADGINYN